MFKNLFSITFRSLSRQGVFSIINILGLSIGLAVVLLISLMNFSELSYDKSFKESKNIYRINSFTKDGERWATTANALGPAIKAEIPEIVATVRTVYREYDMVNNENIVQIKVIWADEDFFRLFNTPFIIGNPEEALKQPNKIAISEKEAKRMFGNKDPIGQILEHTIWKNTPPLEVSAVFKDYPENSSLSDHKIIAPFMFCQERPLHSQITWIVDEFETFCLLVANANPETVNTKIRKIVADATVDQPTAFSTQLERLTAIHLHSKSYAGRISIFNLGDIERVRLMTLLSVIILLVACINYMNLSTARSQKRSREIGISKTVGATRTELMLRLTLETAIFTFASFILAFLLARVLLPTFNNLMDARLTFETAFNPFFLGVALLIWIVTTLLAASYPAIYISGFPLLTAIRTQSMPGSSHAIIRKALNVLQFAVSIVLISWVLIMQAQIIFANSKDLGYNPHNLIGFWIHDSNPTTLLDEFRALSSVEMVSRENQLGNFFGVSENLLFRDEDDKTGFPLRPNATEPNYFDIMQMKMLAGSVFPETQMRDTVIITSTGERFTSRMFVNNFTQIVVNRAVVDYLGLTPEEAIGQRVTGKFSGVYGYPEICGVVENYHYESLHRPIGGVCIHHGLGQHKRYLLLRVINGNMQEQLKTYEVLYKKYFPNNVFEPTFFDDRVSKLYDGERRSVRIAVVFSLLAIFVACMGVFGLTAFMAEQRTKETGIRKVVGASVWDIVRLFTADYVKLLGISLLIAIPLSWWVGVQYLQNFAYRISLNWWMFAASVLITAALTLLTVSILAMKAAMADPVQSIKTE